MKILLFDDHRLFGESLKKLLIESQFVSLCYYVERENEDLKYWQIYYQLIQIQK